MKRDGACNSLWQQTAENYQPQNSWDKDKVYDVLIIGGGITGVTTGLVLQQEGRQCIIAEANTIGFGTTGGTTAHLNTLLDTPYAQIEKNFGEENAKLVARSARESIDLIEGLINKYGIDCGFSYQTGYLFAETDKQAEDLEEIAKAARNAGVVEDKAESIPVPIPFKKAYRFDFQAQLHATRYLKGICDAYEKEGGVVLQHCLVSKIDNDEYITASTTLGSVKAKAVVYATHIPPGITAYSFLCAPYRSYAAAFTLKSGNYPDGLAYDMQDPYHYFRTQEIDGQKYVIAGGFDHKTGHNDNTEYVFTELEAYLRQYFDIDKISSKWSSQYYESADGLPYIGAMPGSSNVFVATGYGGNGIIFGSVAAKVLCCLISEQDSVYGKVYNPGRIKPAASIASLVKENADVISQFIGKRFSYEKVSQLAELAPGEAKLAKWEGKHVALYKDEQGSVHALDPVCPHAGCVVGWNSAEKSWDCPCHGGRYACNGTLLTGPATKGLQQVLWEDINGD